MKRIKDRNMTEDEKDLNLGTSFLWKLIEEMKMQT